MSTEPLSAEDARILALESGTVVGHTRKPIVFAGEHGLDEVRARMEERLGAVPRLRQGCPLRVRLHGPDPCFSIARHVVDRGGADDAGLRRVVAAGMATRLDRGHPLWAMDVVSPLAGWRTALVWRIHPAIADGVTAMRMACALLLEPAEQPREDAFFRDLQRPHPHR